MDACAPRTWQEEENLGREAHLAALPEAIYFYVCAVCKLDRNYFLFAGLTGQYAVSQNS